MYLLINKMPLPTYVTALYNIGRDDANFEAYITWLNYLLSIPVQIVLYTTPEIEQRLIYTARPTLKIIFERTIPYMKYVPTINTYVQNEYHTNNPTKDNPHFICLTHAKFIWLENTIVDNPFNSERFYWIDAGLAKIASHLDYLPWLKTTDKIKCLLITYYTQNDVEHSTWCDRYRCFISAGLFGGSIDNMFIFINKMKSLAMADLGKNRLALEQEYMAQAYYQLLDIFDPYYGHYENLITNWDGPVARRETVEQFRQRAVIAGDQYHIDSVERYLAGFPSPEI